MGYQVVASSAAGTFSDEVWMDLKYFPGPYKTTTLRPMTS
jgi:hypothetical protein